MWRWFFFTSFLIARFKTPLVLGSESDALLLPLRTLDQSAVALGLDIRGIHTAGRSGCVAQAGAIRVRAGSTARSYRKRSELV